MDVTVYAEDRQEHDRLLEEVLRRLQEENLYVNARKVQVAKEEVKLLGVIVNGETQKVTEKARKEMLEYPRPVDTKSLRRFLGKMNYYAPFIRDIAKIAVPLFEKTGKNAKFEWTKDMEESFKQLKEKLVEGICLYLPNYKERFTLETDASDTGLGAVLMQEDKDGRMVPIRWASRKLTKAERKRC